MKELTDIDFDASIEKGVVLVDFWAPWCGPCRMLSPILEEIATEFEGQVLVCKVNIDENPQVAMKYQVVSIPTVLLFKDGEKVESSVGANTKSFYKKLLEKYV